jgi:hypothetical protein
MRLTLPAVALILAACGPQTPASETPPPQAPAAPEAVAPAPEPAAATPAAPIVLTTTEVAARLVGTWRSIDDAKSTITISADGGWISDYADTLPVHEVSTWKLFTMLDPLPGVPAYTLEPGKAYLEVKGRDVSLQYEVGNIDADNLELFYLARGNRHAFTRVK